LRLWRRMPVCMVENTKKGYTEVHGENFNAREVKGIK